MSHERTDRLRQKADAAATERPGQVRRARPPLQQPGRGLDRGLPARWGGPRHRSCQGDGAAGGRPHPADARRRRLESRRRRRSHHPSGERRFGGLRPCDRRPDDFARHRDGNPVPLPAIPDRQWRQGGRQRRHHRWPGQASVRHPADRQPHATVVHRAGHRVPAQLRQPHCGGGGPPARHRRDARGRGAAASRPGSRRLGQLGARPRQPCLNQHVSDHADTRLPRNAVRLDLRHFPYPCDTRGSRARRQHLPHGGGHRGELALRVPYPSRRRWRSALDRGARQDDRQPRQYSAAPPGGHRRRYHDAQASRGNAAPVARCTGGEGGRVHP